MADNKVNFLRGTSAEYETKTKDNDTFYYTTDTKKLYLGENEITGIEIDDTATTVTDKTWSAKKINDSIPTELPANGGNADTVGNKGISQILAIKGWFDGDMDDLKEQGSYVANEATNMPISGGWGTVLVFVGGTGSVVQVFTAYVTSASDLCKTYIRHFTGNLWSTWVNIADSGNADTIDDKHASDFVDVNDIKTQIEIPSDTNNPIDVPMWIQTNGKRYTRYSTYGSSGRTNVPNNSGDWVWYYFDGNNIIAREHITDNVWTAAVVNGVFTGWKLINSSDADTVDGLHASDFSQIISFGDTPTDTKTAIGIQSKTTTYWCSQWTDYPATLQDGQGMIIAVNYKSYGTSVGVDNIWCRQIYITPHDSKIYQRLISATTVGEWIGIIDGGTVASSTSSGIVSTGEQHFRGRKFFDDSVFISNPDFLVGSTLPSTDTTRLLIFASSDNSTGNASAWVQNIARAGGNNELYLSLRSLTSKKTFTALCAKINADGSNYYTFVTNPTQSTQVALRNISSGTSAATTTNCPSGSWYGKHS